MKIYIIRHGQTKLNKMAALQGRSDHPLNEQGILQAERVGSLLREQGIDFDKIYSSPLSRAIKTAQIVAGQETKLYIDDRLIEMDYGPYEGTDLKQLPSELTYFFSDFVHHPAPEGMEPLQSVVQRMGCFLDELRQKDAACGNILISTHAIAMKGALEYLTPGSDGRYWSKFIGNCAVYTAENGPEGFSLPEEIM